MALIYKNSRYMLSSYSGSTAYEIVRLSDNASVFLQGDEASDFRDEYSLARNAAEAVSESCVNNLFSAYDDVMRNKFEE